MVTAVKSKRKNFFFKLRLFSLLNVEKLTYTLLIY